MPPKSTGETPGCLAGVKRSGHAVILAGAEIDRRDRLAFHNERAAHHFRLAVVVGVIVRLALEDPAADRDFLVEFAALKRQKRLGHYNLISLAEKLDHALTGRRALWRAQGEEYERRGKDSAHVLTTVVDRTFRALRVTVNGYGVSIPKRSIKDSSKAHAGLLQLLLYHRLVLIQVVRADRYAAGASIA
jgi:hypothetical protein